ncbi:uncharacterized protein LOC144633002 [Oculina patagonica]
MKDCVKIFLLLFVLSVGKADPLPGLGDDLTTLGVALEGKGTTDEGAEMPNEEEGLDEAEFDETESDEGENEILQALKNDPEFDEGDELPEEIKKALKLKVYL